MSGQKVEEQLVLVRGVKGGRVKAGKVSLTSFKDMVSWGKAEHERTHGPKLGARGRD